MSKVFKGIDVSEWQGTINWDLVKSQVDYVMLRCGYGSDLANQDDKYFIRNANECVRLNIPFGVYLYSYATNVDMAYSEALHTLRLIEKYKLDYPIYIDIEDRCQSNLSPKQLGDIVDKFCKTLESHNCFVGVYASKSWFENKLTDSRINLYTKWIAQWNDVCTYNGAYGMWQYSDKGVINGINGNVDTNFSFKDFSSIIRQGFNGWEKDKNVIEVGSKVKIKKGAKSYYGVNLASFVYDNTYTVISINNDRVVVGINGNITTDIHLKDLII